MAKNKCRRSAASRLIEKWSTDPIMVANVRKLIKELAALWVPPAGTLEPDTPTGAEGEK